MKYMLEIPANGSPWAHLNEAQLKEVHSRVKGALGNGSIDCAYSKVGGGGYVVVNVDDHAQLQRTLRMLDAHDVNIIPISALEDVLEEYIEQHESGAHVKHMKKAQEHIDYWSNL
ncbi:MAG: hypothetical protein R3293_00845 [Candidatus Promineifilaceae bacterium]|nr:hypothetical protein [Candidatus Promineifilaceae bacterium]